jgi:Fe-S cluster biosynthesis and repair protein YggX/rhodanese-related sulfurtransferase
MDIVRVAPEEARELAEREGYVLVDVRTAAEFAAGHPTGAYNIPFLHQQTYGRVANPDFAKVVQAVFPDKATKLVLSCASGGRSARAATELAKLGYAALRDLRGGFEGEKDDAGTVTYAGWRDRGLPFASGDAPGRSYVELYARLSAPLPPPSTPPAARSHAHGHAHAAHGGHEHDAPAAAPKLNRFADPVRLVDCVKLGARLPALKRRPMGGPLGQRIFDTISADAWDQWVEHSKLLINEYRLNPAEAKAQEMLVRQCEQFLFGEGAEKPREFVPDKA